MADNGNKIYKQIIELPKTVAEAVRKAMRDEKAAGGGGVPNPVSGQAAAAAAAANAKNAEISAKKARKEAALREVRELEDIKIEYASKKRMLADYNASTNQIAANARSAEYSRRYEFEKIQRDRDALIERAAAMPVSERANSSIGSEISKKDLELSTARTDYDLAIQETKASKRALNAGNLKAQKVIKDITRVSRSIEALKDEIDNIDEYLVDALDTTPVKKLEKETTKLTRAFGILKASAGTIRVIGAGLGAALGGVVGGIAAARAMDPTEEIANLAIQTGMSLKNLSALRQAAREVGLEFDEVKASLVAVPQVLGEAFSGDSGAIELLTRMKLDVKELKGMSIDDAITKVLLQMGRLKADPQAVPLISAIIGEDVQSKLLPALRQMADQGIDYFAEKAVKAGTMVTDSSAKTAKATNNAIRDMQASLDGLAISISQKSGPQLEYMAKTFKELLPTITDAVMAMGNFAVKTIEVTKSTATFVAGVSSDVSNWSAAPAQSNFQHFVSKPLARFITGTTGIKDYSGSRVNEAKATGEYQAAIEAYANQIGGLPPPLPVNIGAPLPPLQLPPVKPQPTGSTTATATWYSDYFDASIPLDLPPAVKEGGASSIDVMKDSVASLTNELSILQQKLTELEQVQTLLNQQNAVKTGVDIAEMEVELAQGRIDAADLLTAKLDVADTNAQAEIDMLGEKEDLLTKIIAKSEEIAKLDPNQGVNVSGFKAELLVVKEQSALIGEQLAADKAAVVREVTQASLDASKTIAQSQIDIETELGNVQVDRAKAIADKLREFQIELAKINEMDGAGKARALLAYQEKLQLVERGMVAEENANRESLRFENEKALLEAAAEEGEFAKYQLGLKVFELEKQRIPVMREMLKVQLELAKTSGNVVKVAEYQQSLDMLDAYEGKLGRSKDAMFQIGETLKESLVSNVSGLLDGLIDGTQTLSQAFRSMALSIIKDLGSMAAKALTNLALNAILNAGGGGAGGAPVAASTGGQIGTLAGAQKLAGGGRVMGGGTVTSDSVPTLLSNQEFVVRGAAALQHGAYDFLNRFNSVGMQALTEYAAIDPSIYGDVGSGLGKVVGAGGVGGGSASVQLGLEEGLVLKHMDSPEGTKTLVKMLSKNRKQIKGMLG